MYSIQAGNNARWNTAPGASLTSSFDFLFELPLPLASASLSNTFETRGFDTTSNRCGITDTPAIAVELRADRMGADAMHADTLPANGMQADSTRADTTQADIMRADAKSPSLR
ncbi:hypothetical protein [Pigmentiphaga litoralis]|uniref:hypothetical protein n=1 Tax=Pigmentiphaga litoralis TaxID=516702 RepID=UPI003B42ED2D